MSGHSNSDVGQFFRPPLAGVGGSATIADGSITAPKLAAGVLPASVRRGALFTASSGQAASTSWAPSTASASEYHFSHQRSSDAATNALLGSPATGYLNIWRVGATLHLGDGATSIYAIADAVPLDATPHDYSVVNAAGQWTVTRDGVVLGSVASGVTLSTSASAHYISGTSAALGAGGTLHDVRLIDPANDANTAYFPLDGLDASGTFPNEHPGSAVADATVTGSIAFVPILALAGQPFPIVPGDWISGGGGSLGSVLLGPDAGQSLTTGASNTAFGRKAGRDNTTGSNWTAVGYQAGRNSTTGSNWTAIGREAGSSNTIGSQWTAVGFYAGLNSTSGSNWTALGYHAGRDNTTGSNWTALGYQAGRGNTTGSDWIAIGYFAGRVSIAGSRWTAIGREAGRNNTNGNNWTALGYQAGSAVTSSSSSTYIGSFTGVGYETTNNVLALSTGTTLRFLFDGANYYLPSLPTIDPALSGALWNDAGTLKVSI